MPIGFYFEREREGGRERGERERYFVGAKFLDYNVPSTVQGHLRTKGERGREREGEREEKERYFVGG